MCVDVLIVPLALGTMDKDGTMPCSCSRADDGTPLPQLDACPKHQPVAVVELDLSTQVRRAGTCFEVWLREPDACRSVFAGLATPTCAV